MRRKIVQVQNVGGGINDYERPHEIGPSEMRNTSRNIRSAAGAYEQRKGYTTFAETLGGGGIQSMGMYLRNADADDRMVVVQDNRVLLIDPANEDEYTEVFQKFLTSQATINAMDATTNWAAGTDTTIALNTTTKIEGTGSLELEKTGTSGSTASVTYTGSISVADKYIGFYVYTDTAAALAKLHDTTTCTLTLTDSVGDTFTYTASKDDMNLKAGAWGRFYVYIDNMTQTGTPVATDIVTAKIEFTAIDSSQTWSDENLLIDYMHKASQSNAVDIVSYRDWLFLFNGVDKPIRIDDTTATQDFTQPASLTAATFLPAFGDVYGASLFVGGVPTAKNTVFISKASTSASPQYVYDFSGTLTDFGDADEILLKNRVTAIRKLATAIVIFTVEEAVYVPGLQEFSSTVTFEVQPIGGASGCVSQQCCTVVENDIFYLTPKKEIRSIRRGFSDQLSVMTTALSTKIQNFMNENIDDDMSTAWSVYDDAAKEYRLHVKPKGGTTNSLVLVADLRDVDQQGIPSWYIDDNKPHSAGVYYKGKVYVGSAAIGQVYLDADGLSDDDDASIISKRVSKDYVADNPTNVKRFRELVIYGEMTIATSIDVNIYVDEQLIVEATITGDDIPGQSGVSGGGIGTYSIGTEAIGMDGESESVLASERLPFTKRIPFRQDGKRMRIETITDGNVNDYTIRSMEYSYLDKSRTYTPIIER